MSAAVRERTTTHTTAKRIVTHGGPISGQSHGTLAMAGTLENNLDALLEDLQTSISRSATPNRGERTLSPQVEYRLAANPTKVLTEGGSGVSPTRTSTTTTEKFVSTGPAGVPSDIPGLELLDAELQNVQPGQSKTVAYKQVSYQYNKTIDGKPVESWTTAENVMPDTLQHTTGSMYEESKTRHRSPEATSRMPIVQRELTSTPTSSHQRDIKYVQESSRQHTEAQNHEYGGGVEYVPVPSPTPAIPLNLAPGPNTKVTTTIKTYTYELPGAPETYLPGGSLPGGAVLPGDQTITYTLPRGNAASSMDKSVTHQNMTESIPAGTSPARYGSTPPPTEITKKSTTLHKEAKYYREEHHNLPPPPGGQPLQSYQSSVFQTNVESRTASSQNDKYQVDENYPNTQVIIDKTDHPGSLTTIYQNQPPIINESHTTTINRIEEHYPSRPPSSSRHLTPEKPATPIRGGPSTQYTVLPQTTSPGTTVYKFSNTTTTIPPSKHAEDHEVLLPKPFPTDGIQICPSNDKPIRNSQNGEGPPKRLEDLMASFSDTEREVLEHIERKEKEQQQKTKESLVEKKEVDFVPHTPPQVKSKNVAGPPVYYPPGSAEFTKKEESAAAMSQSSGGWQKASAKYEYEASSKSKSKSSSGAAVVPLCLPLCCAMPCVIM